MTIKAIETKLATIKPGVITKVHYKTTKGDYAKETKTRVRFVAYAHIKGVQAKGQSNPNETHVVKNALIFNKNTNKHYLQMAVVNGVKPQVSYSYKGQPITKAEYDLANPSKPFNSPVFRKDIADIISLG